MSDTTPRKALEHVDRLVAWKNGQKPAPVTLEWDLSNRCYLGCQSCHFAHTHVRGPWLLKDRRLPMAFESTGDLANVATVCRGLLEAAEFGVRGIVWSGGGEPTTHPDWQHIFRHAKACKLEQGLYTAGGLLKADTAAVLAKLMKWVVVSLDAVSRDVYAREKGVNGFEAATSGVRWLAEAGADVSVSFLLHAENWQDIFRMVDLSRSLGARSTTFRPTIETSPDDPATCIAERDWVTNALPALEAVATLADVECNPARFIEYRDWHGRSYAVCHGIKLNATVTPDGRVWVCPQRRGVRGSEIGNLTEESFDVLWQRHVGQWTDFSSCRVMCRLHLVNEVCADVFATHDHGAFV